MTFIPQSDTESVNSLKFTVPETESDFKLEPDNLSTENIAPDDEFTDFESCKPEPVINWSSTLTPVQLPLRETHISTETSFEPKYLVDEGNWLGSTVNSPVLPRKVETNDDDDFTDFQMSLPPPTKEMVSTKPVKTVPTKLLEKNVNKQIEPISSKPFQTVASKPFKTLVTTPIEPVADKPLEPLKPFVLQPSVVSVSTTINWPEPGIVDDVSISEIDLKLQNFKTNDDGWSDFVSVPNAETQLKIDPFVTMQTSSNFSSLIQNVNNLPSTQLELSVSDLQNTQLYYKSLPQMHGPVLNPLGKNSPNIPPSTQQIAAQQVQTGYQPPYQIPLNNSIPPSQFGLEPTEIGPPPTVRKARNTHMKRNSNLNEKTLLPTSKIDPLKPIEIDASINTTKLSANSKPSPGIFNDLSFFSPKKEPKVTQNVQPVQSIENTFMTMQQTALPSNDEDDWSDFVSHQNVPQTNGWSLPQKSNTKPNLNSSEMTPNIITNPVHFDVFQSYQGTSQEKNKKSGNSFTQNSVPTVSTLPELDFIAPKSKFFTKK